MTNPQPESDPVDVESLCRRAAGGDGDALEQLFCLHHRRMMGLLKRKIGVQWQGKIEPEDLLQEAYAECCRSIAQFSYQGEDSFYRWLTQIADHRFYSLVRHWSAQKRDAARESATGAARRESLYSLLDDCLGDTATPSLFAQRQDAAAALLGCIARLPDDYRAIIQRLHLDQAPLAMVAAESSRSEDAVRRLSGRAVEKLRECLGRASQYLSRMP